MQSNKASKKTNKVAEEKSTATPGLGTTDTTSTPRASKSSKSKSDNNETGPARHRKASSPVANETSAMENVPAAKAFAASAGTGSQPVDFPVDVAASSPGFAKNELSSTVTSEEVATLAHYYWMARGCAHGFAEEDWLRAERELKAKRAIS